MIILKEMGRKTVEVLSESMYHYNPQSGLSQNFEKNISIQICMEKF
jgi:hypothetical protein